MPDRPAYGILVWGYGLVTSISCAPWLFLPYSHRWESCAYCRVRRVLALKVRYARSRDVKSEKRKRDDG